MSGCILRIEQCLRRSPGCQSLHGLRGATLTGTLEVRRHFLGFHDKILAAPLSKITLPRGHFESMCGDCTVLYPLGACEDMLWALSFRRPVDELALLRPPLVLRTSSFVNAFEGCLLCICACLFCRADDHGCARVMGLPPSPQTGQKAKSNLPCCATSLVVARFSTDRG